MTSGLKEAKDAWLCVDTLLKKWLSEREELLKLYVEMNGLPPYQEHAPNSSEVQAFCQILMDYISAGHFEVYEKLLEEDRAFGGQGQDLLQQLYPRIVTTTQVALNFNDSAETIDMPNAQFHEVLSQLGEALAERLELEDQLITNLHESHTQDITAL